FFVSVENICLPGLGCNCSLFVPTSRTQLRTSAAIPPDTYPQALERARPRRWSVREDGENGVGREARSSSSREGEGERGRTKAGLRREVEVEVGVCDAGVGGA